jgi:hypothetical protein
LNYCLLVVSLLRAVLKPGTDGQEDKMKIAACVIAAVGAVIGILTATVQGHTPHYELVTIVLSIIGGLAGILLLVRPRIAMWTLLIVAVLGVIPDAILWEGAGSFFLVSGLLGISIIRGTKEA